MSNEALIASLRDQINMIESGKSSPSSKLEEHSEEGRSASEEQGEVRATIQDSQSSSAFKKILALVNASDKSEKAIRERLLTAGFDDIEIENAIQQAKRYSIIDDARFADVLVRSRLAQKRGIAGIERELKQHGIDPLGVRALQEESPSYEEQIDTALELLTRKPPKSKNKREGAYRRLVQRGYSSSVASSASRMWAESLE